MIPEKVQIFLNRKVEEYNQHSFIQSDPICVPHRYTKKQDIEIAAFFSAIFAWGKRPIIISKATSLMDLMDHAPHDFCLHAGANELKRLLTFKHRTFNATDLLYFVEFLRHHYSNNNSLETAFSQWMQPEDVDTARALSGFYRYCFSLEDIPQRSKKHISTPDRKSTCKRLNMFLRWMVRKDNRGVDFGLWENISPRQLICPIDVHVARVARHFRLIHREQTDWATALELTACLKELCPEDPVKYDFALFGLGITENF